MTFVNERGAHYMTLTVLGTENPELNCMLKTPILKKSENWTVQLTDFILSRQPLINPHIKTPFLEIKAYFDGVALANIYGTDHIFTPNKCTSVLTLYRELFAFCQKFTQLFYSYGLGDGNNNQVYSSAEVEDEFFTNAERNTKKLVEDKSSDNFLRVRLTADLKLEFILGRDFCHTFYIELSDYASEMIGLPKNIFHLQDDAGNAYTSSKANPTVYEELGFVTFDTGVVFDLNDREVILEDGFGVRIISEESIKNYDERMSIDLVSTFPVSRKVCVFNGKHQEDYLLGRFDLSSFRDFNIEQEYSLQIDQYSEPNTQIIEKHHVSAFNLTTGFPNYESNHFINGPVQSVNLKLFARYINRKKEISTQLMDMEDGFFQVRCLFTKKI